MAITHKHEDYWFGQISSVSEAMKDCGDYYRRARKQNRADDVLTDPKWRGLPKPVKTWEQLTELVQSVWVKGVNLYESFRPQIESVDLPQPVSMKRKRRFNNVSGEVDIDRAMKGEQDLFVEAKRSSIHGPAAYRIVIPMSYSSSVDEADIIWATVSAAVMADVLEDSGRQCEIHMVFGGLGSYPSNPEGIRHSFEAVCCKETNDPLDIVSIMNATSAWFFRTVGFSMQDSHPCIHALASRGRPIPTHGATMQFCLNQVGLLEDGCPTLLMPRILSKREAMEWVRETLAEICAGTQAPEFEDAM
jgi:hypothetical protein